MTPRLSNINLRVEGNSLFLLYLDCQLSYMFFLLLCEFFHSLQEITRLLSIPQRRLIIISFSYYHILWLWVPNIISIIYLHLLVESLMCRNWWHNLRIYIFINTFSSKRTLFIWGLKEQLSTSYLSFSIYLHINCLYFSSLTFLYIIIIITLCNLSYTSSLFME